MAGLFEDKGKVTYLIPPGAKHDLAVSFLERCRWLENGCVIYEGGHSVRIPYELYFGARFTTPRRAAYILDTGQIPDFQLKAECNTPDCVNTAHLVPGRPLRRNRPEITRELILNIRRDRSQSIRALAKKYGLDRKKIRKILELGLEFPHTCPKAYKPYFGAYGF